MPFAVHTGWVKGCNETEQKLKGKRLKDEPGALGFAVPDPLLAE